MRIFKALVVLVGFPIFGAAAGFMIGGLLLPSTPTGERAPGDGFQILFGMGIGLVISTLIAVALAVRIISGTSPKLQTDRPREK
jgi:hypothetical protein